MSEARGKCRLRSGVLGVLSVMVLAAAAPDESPVADASARGDVEAVRALIREGADPNAAQADGMTALHWSALNDEIEIAEVLLYAGANPQSTTRLGGYTPLHLASRAGNAAVVEALLEAGADPGAYTTTGVTAMHFAAEANATEVIRALVVAGADLDAKDSFSSRTPLMFASARNATAALQALLDFDADVSLATAIKDYEKISEEATEESARRTRVREAAKDPKEEEDEEEDTQGANARRGGQGQQGRPDEGRAQPPALPNAPKALTSIEQIGKQGGFTALHYAARNGHVEAARLLVAAGTDVDQLTAGDQSSALLVAVINGNYDLARALLESGADPNLVSDDAVGPLFATLNIEWSLRTWYPQPQAFRQQWTSYLELVELLLDAGADPNQRTITHVWYASYNAGRMGVDFAGVTPFWRAAYATDVKAMRLLVEHGADPNIWSYNIINPRRRFGPNRPNAGNNEDGEDPSGLPPVPHGGLGIHPLHAASGVGFGTSRVAQQHRAVPDGWLPSMKYLIEELGIDPNLRDKDGLTALHNSAARGDNETILYLVSKGADVTLISRRGQTTADLANSPEQRAQPHPVTVALLEKLGSKNNHQCRSCGG